MSKFPEHTLHFQFRRRESPKQLRKLLTLLTVLPCLEVDIQLAISVILALGCGCKFERLFRLVDFRTVACSKSG